jgi:hypothetical protein
LSACEALANLGGDRPIEPLSACDKEDGPGPGIDVPDAPASGTSLSRSACDSARPPIGICPRVEGVPGDAAKRAVELALVGEPERVVSPRKEEDGIGLAFGEAGLLSLCVNRPAIVDRVCSERWVRRVVV